jgi:hypothetical protein
MGKRVTWKVFPESEVERGSLLPAHDLLGLLGAESPEDLVPVLRMLCPCRNLCYDQAVWARITALSVDHPVWWVREQALHALVTVRERARFDRHAVELLQWLAEQGWGSAVHPRWLRQELERGRSGAGIRYPKIARRDVPSLLEALASDNIDEQNHALQGLCPGRGRRYSVRVWEAIFEARGSVDALTRNRAATATRRLLDHARADPYAAAVLERVLGDHRTARWVTSSPARSSISTIGDGIQPGSSRTGQASSQEAV